MTPLSRRGRRAAPSDVVELLSRLDEDDVAPDRDDLGRDAEEPSSERAPGPHEQGEP
jgi:hypothetical protein